MYFVVDTKKCGRLGLTGANALVYSALRMLAKKKPWKGSLRELAEISRCGCYETARVCVAKLLQQGIIVNDSDGYILSENLTSTKTEMSENLTKLSENLTKSKEENERTKEKEEKINKKENVGVDNNSNTPSADAPCNFLDFQNIDSNDMTNYASRKAYYQTIVGEFGFLHPGTILDTFENYYTGHGWPERGDRVALLRNWLRHERKKPALNEQERVCLGYLLQDVAPAVYCRFCDVLQGFAVNDVNVVFYFMPEHLRKVADWIGGTKIPDIIQTVYKRGTQASPYIS